MELLFFGDICNGGLKPFSPPCFSLDRMCCKIFDKIHECTSKGEKQGSSTFCLWGMHWGVSSSVASRKKKPTRPRPGRGTRAQKSAPSAACRAMSYRKSSQKACNRRQTVHPSVVPLFFLLFINEAQENLICDITLLNCKNNKANCNVFVFSSYLFMICYIFYNILCKL